MYLLAGTFSINPFYKNQHSYRRGRSTETALDDLVYKVEKALHYKEVALAVSFDIEGISTAAICQTLQESDLIGHCTLRRHLSLLGVKDDSTCPKCGKDDETSFHFLGEAYGRLVFKVFWAMTLLREELRTLAWAEILSFIRESVRFG